MKRRDETVSVGDLHPDPRTARRHTPRTVGVDAPPVDADAEPQIERGAYGPSVLSRGLSVTSVKNILGGSFEAMIRDARVGSHKIGTQFPPSECQKRPKVAHSVPARAQPRRRR